MADPNPLALADLPSTFPTVPIKLTCRNYHFWRGVMSPLLETYDLLDQVEGRVPAPDKTIDRDGTVEPNPAYRRWLTRDKFALTCLMLAVTEEIGCFLVGAQTSHGAWRTLSTLFDSQTEAWEDFLDRQWYDLRRANLPVTELIDSVERLATSFAQIGRPKPAAEVNRCIVNCLGIEWEPLILALSPSLSTMSTDKLTALLLDKEARQILSNSQEQTAPFPVPQAHYAAGRNSSPAGGGRGRGGAGGGGGYGGRGRSNPTSSARRGGFARASFY